MTDTDHTTDEATTPSPADMPVDPSSSPVEASDMGSLPQWAQKLITSLRSENKGQRARAKDAEAERDSLRDQLGDLNRKAALDSVADLLDDPDDLARYTDLQELVDDAGNPSPDKYREAATALVADRPRLAPAPAPPKSSGTAPEDTTAPAPTPDAGQIMSGLIRGSAQ